MDLVWSGGFSFAVTSILLLSQSSPVREVVTLYFLLLLHSRVFKGFYSSSMNYPVPILSETLFMSEYDFITPDPDGGRHGYLTPLSTRTIFLSGCP